jgi:hypothetical protein
MSQGWNEAGGHTTKSLVILLVACCPDDCEKYKRCRNRERCGGIFLIIIFPNLRGTCVLGSAGTSKEPEEANLLSKEPEKAIFLSRGRRILFFIF